MSNSSSSINLSTKEKTNNFLLGKDFRLIDKVALKHTKILATPIKITNLKLISETNRIRIINNSSNRIDVSLDSLRKLRIIIVTLPMATTNIDVHHCARAHQDHLVLTSKLNNSSNNSNNLTTLQH